MAGTGSEPTTHAWSVVCVLLVVCLLEGREKWVLSLTVSWSTSKLHMISLYLLYVCMYVCMYVLVGDKQAAFGALFYLLYIIPWYPDTIMGQYCGVKLLQHQVLDIQM